MSAQTDKRFAEAFAKLSPTDQAAALVHMGAYGQCIIHATDDGRVMLVPPPAWISSAPDTYRWPRR